LQKFIDP